MSGLRLVDVASYIPTNRPRVVDSYEEIGITPMQAKIFDRVYMLQAFSVAPEATPLDFLSRPIESLLSKHKDIADRVKLIIYAHTSTITTAFGESVVCDIQRKFDFHNAIPLGTMLNKCVSSVKALEMAEQFLMTQGEDDLAIIISGEICYSTAVRHIPNTSIGGDAAIAALVSVNRGDHQLLKSKTIVNGAYAKGMWMDQSELAVHDAHYIKGMTSIIEGALSEAGLSLNDINIILPHNVNLPSWQKVAASLGISIDKFYVDNIPKIAHALGADVFLNWQSAYQAGRIKKGDKSMMISVGLGASYGYAIWQH